MRIHLTFKLRNNDADNKITYNYWHFVSSWIYRMLGMGDQKFAGDLCNNGIDVNKRRYKFFTFSGLHFIPSKSDSEWLYVKDSEINLCVSFFLNDAAGYFLDGLKKTKNVEFGDSNGRVELYIENCEKVAEPAFADRMKFRTVSPLCIAEKTDKWETYLEPGSENFQELFVKNICEKYFTILEHPEYCKLLNVHLSQISGCHPEFKLIELHDSKLITLKDTGAKEIKVRGFKFSFTLNAPVEIIKLGYYGGFGVRNGQGFGYVDIIP